MAKQIDNVNHHPDADEVLDLVHAVMHEYRAQQHRLLREGGHAITPMDGKVLNFFARRPGATQSDLAAHSGRDKGQLARLVKGLRERGLLAAESDADDRRSLQLQLTAAGQEIQRSLRQQSRRLGARAVVGLSAEERIHLAALLQRVQANLAAG